MPGSPARAPLVSWAGGALFVAALALFGWMFFVRFEPAAPVGPRLRPVVLNTLLFGLFALHHSLLARTGAKRWLGRHLPPSLERTSYVWISSLLFIGVCLLWQPVPGLLYRQTGVWALPHWLAVGAGAWLTVAGARVMDPLELAGIRQAAGASQGPRFRVVGPYHFVRHPIYLGWLLLVFGVPVMTGTRLAFAVISSAYLILAIPFEERSLVEQFGDEYRRYQQRVRSRLVPGVW
jgi:protein-S-isoprenylcysteine O-methyltransferase Ste14